jgi:predicted nucleotidyltransferase
MMRLPQHRYSAAIHGMSVSAVPNSKPLWQQRTGVTPEQIARFCDRWGISEFSLFGSVVRDDFGPDSDVDVMIRLNLAKSHGGWDWIDMIDELQAMFGRKVDLTSPKILDNPFRRKTILADLQVVYAA